MESLKPTEDLDVVRPAVKTEDRELVSLLLTVSVSPSAGLRVLAVPMTAA